MKVKFKPEGGRYGYGFDYFCTECGKYVGNSSANDQLIHPATEKSGKLFRKVEVPIKCSQAGKICKLPEHAIDAPELK